MKSDLKSASITLYNTLANAYLRHEDFPKNNVKIVVLFYSLVNYCELAVLLHSISHPFSQQNLLEKRGKDSTIYYLMK